MKAAKIKKEKPAPVPILLKTIIPFGKYKGRIIQQLLNKDGFINWFAATTKRPISQEVLNAIQQYKFLSA